MNTSASGVLLLIQITLESARVAKNLSDLEGEQFGTEKLHSSKIAQEVFSDAVH
jgi:hypothetical protein